MISDRNLRLLVVGQFVSAIGDQFYLIAVPWLALQITGRGFVAGTLLAVASVPRAVLMLLGGAASDRYSAKTLLISSNGIQAILMAFLGLAMLVPFTSLWFLYLLAFLTGSVDAFGLPALNSILPRIVETDELEGGNVYLQGANMVSGVIGPALAGLLISLASTNAGTRTSLSGIGLAFLFNALTFLIGISLFWSIQMGDMPETVGGAEDSLIASIPQVFEYVQRDMQLRYIFLLMLLLGLFLSGTIRVGLPLLAMAHQSGGVRQFGNMSSAFGAGLLAGMISVRLLPKPPRPISGIVILALFGMVPIGLILLGIMPPITVTLAVILVMGWAVGYVMIYLLSWLQRRTPDHLLGRIMAVVFFATIGLSPLSQILMGYLLDINLQSTMIGVGSLVLIILGATSTRRRMWSLEVSGPTITDHPTA